MCGDMNAKLEIRKDEERFAGSFVHGKGRDG